MKTLSNAPFGLAARTLATSGLALLIAMPALAQVADEAGDGRVLDRVVITAQKVEQDLQDVPVSVTAVPGVRLEETGTVSLENIGDLVPSVTFRKGTTNANSALVMRGVGTITFSVAAEPSVSTVVDGIVLSRSGQAFIDLVDIERLEVLRGPQGTLFGKNASAGLLNIVSKGGSETPEGQVSAELFDDEEYRLKATAAGPLNANGSITGRLSGFFGTYDGNITNVFGGGNNTINGYEHYGARGIVDFDAGQARFRVIGDFFKADDDCCAEVTGVSRGAALDGELGFNNRQGEDTRQVNHNLVTQSNDEQTSLTFSADYDFANNYVLSVVTGWRDWENTEIREGDFLPRPVVGTAELHDLGKVETDQFSLEVRLASAQDKPFRYQVGTFYWASDNRQDFTRRVISCASSTLPVAPSGARPCNLINPNPTTPATLYPTATSRSDVNVENTAVFGQADFDITQQITATVGLRYTNDTLNYVHTRAPGADAVTGRPATGPGVSGNPAGGTLASGGNGTNTSFGSSDNSNVSGKAALTWQPTDNFTGFASYTRGYKGPAFNVFFNHTAPTNAVPIDEETSDSYEIGFKSRWFGNRAELNVSVFDVTYEGFQANNFVLLNGAVVTNLTNAGTVGSTGFEVDAVWLAMEGLTLRSSVAYADARVEKFNANPLTNAPDARNGTRLPLAPEWAYNVGGEYENDWAFGKYYVNTLYSYTGDQFSDLGEGGPLESYGVLNGSIGFSDASDTFRLTFIGRNLLDESYVLLNTSNGQRLHIPRDADRYFGVGLRAKF